MSNLKKCQIIDIINQKITNFIQTPCGKFLIGFEGQSIVRYNLETEQKYRIAGSIDQSGFKDGTRDESRFNYPQDLILSKDLKTLFVSDTNNLFIRAICVQSGITTTIYSQIELNNFIWKPKKNSVFSKPTTLTFTPDSKTLLVTDWEILRSICMETGQIDTICTCEDSICNVIFFPDGKHIFIETFDQILKYNLETREFEIILNNIDVNGCYLSKDGQFLFLSDYHRKLINVINIATNDVDTIVTNFNPRIVTKTTNEKRLYVNNVSFVKNEVVVLDISEYCTNFKTFTQLQLAKHSFLPRIFITRF
jgi:DNA-binding beta-propeller fold protein YncE